VEGGGGVLRQRPLRLHPGLRRDGYDRLLQAIAWGKVDVVLTYHVDRLFRQDKERLRFYEVCTKRGST